MPRGPFSPVEQPELATPRLTQETFAPSAEEAGAGVFDAVAKGVQAVGGVLAERQSKKVQEDLTSNLDAIEQALHAARDPEALQAVFDGAAQGNPFFMRAKEELTRIKDAVGKGTMPGDHAVTRTKAVLRDAVRDAPEFAEELQQAARTALGFSPEAESFQRALRGFGQTAEKTAAEKAIDNLVSLGIQRETAHGIVLKHTLNEFEAQDIKTRIAAGEVAANEMGHLANLEASKVVDGIMSSVLGAMQNNGGIFDPNAAKVLAMSQLQSVQATALQNLPPETPLTARTTIMNQMNAAHKTIVEMIDNGAMKTLLESRTETLGAVMKEKAFQSFPFLRSITAIAGPEAATQALAMFSTYQTEAQRGAARKVSPIFGAFETLGSFAEGLQSAALKLEGGAALDTLTQQERVAIAALDTRIVTSPAKPAPGVSPSAHTQSVVQSFNRLVENVDKTRVLKLLDDPRTKAQVKGVPELQVPVAQLVAQQVDSLRAGLAAIRESDRAALFVRDGKLVVDPNKLPHSGTPGQLVGVSPDTKRLVNDVNILLQVGNDYASMGVVKFTTTAETMLNPPAEEAEEAEAAPQPQRAKRRRYDPETGGFTDITEE